MIIVKPNKTGIQQAVEILKSGGVIVYPTDTAYALGGKFNSKKVINKVLQIKERRDEKFTIIASSLNQVRRFFKLNFVAKKLAKKYWPGPLSIVVSNCYAVRVPKNKISQSLSQKAGFPLIATSANISGAKTPYQVQEILRQFVNKKNQPDLILDSGRLPRVNPSTLIKAENGKIKILRRGPIDLPGSINNYSSKSPKPPRQ